MRSCLIVGAQEETRSAVHSVLARRKFDILEVASADEALYLCRHAMPDLVVYDDSSGHGNDRSAFLRRLRRSSRGRRPVVLYCSARSDASAMGSAIVDGASECLITPFDEELLEFKLEQAGLDVGVG